MNWAATGILLVSLAAPSFQVLRAEEPQVVVANESLDRRPEYESHRPAWGVSLTGSVDALGGKDVTSAQAGSTIRSFMLQAEYQLPFLQSIGVLGFGPSLGMYPIFSPSNITASPVSIWSAGGQVRYQARYFREQPIVPMVGYQFEALTYRFAGAGPNGRVSVSSPFVGLMILLNWMEPTSTFEAYRNWGISRTYLLAEYKVQSGSDANLSISGQTLFFGLRFEF